jgi:hypothetical protein
MEKEEPQGAGKQQGPERWHHSLHVSGTSSLSMNDVRRILAKAQVRNQLKSILENYFHGDRILFFWIWLKDLIWEREKCRLCFGS